MLHKASFAAKPVITEKLQSNTPAHVLYPATGINRMEDIDSLFTTMENNHDSNGCYGKEKGGAFHMDKFLAVQKIRDANLVVRGI